MSNVKKASETATTDFGATPVQVSGWNWNTSSSVLRAGPAGAKDMEQALYRWRNACLIAIGSATLAEDEIAIRALRGEIVVIDHCLEAVPMMERRLSLSVKGER
jgi:hypothetical protein